MPKGTSTSTLVTLVSLLAGTTLLGVLGFPPIVSLSASTSQGELHEDEHFQRMYYGVSESCLVCHGDYKLFSTSGNSRKYYYVDRDAFSRSVHFKLGCLGCHGPMRSGVHMSADPASETPVQRQEEELARLRLCFGCHAKQAQDYKRSVHGIAALQYRVGDAPLCVDCHGSHYVLPKMDPQSHTYPSNVAALCAKCHGSTEIYAKYGISPDVISTYSESFHGKKEALGYEPVPVCTSCHGTHLIYSMEDSRSLVNDANISVTCGQCHPGATKSFKAAFSHKRVAPLQKAVLFYVEQFYLWMIFFIIGAMVLVILINILHHTRRMRST